MRRMGMRTRAVFVTVVIIAGLAMASFAASMSMSQTINRLLPIARDMAIEAKGSGQLTAYASIVRPGILAAWRLSGRPQGGIILALRQATGACGFILLARYDDSGACLGARLESVQGMGTDADREILDAILAQGDEGRSRFRAPPPGLGPQARMGLGLIGLALEEGAVAIRTKGGDS